MITALALSAFASDRLALVAATSDGGTGRPVLQHTTADAERIAHVLVELGGVDPHDLRLLIDPSVDQVREALTQLAERLGTRDWSQAVLYFTGHADAEGLRFGNERLSYGELRSAVEALPGGMRVVVIDACASGAVLRGKGGTFASPLVVEPDLDGIAYLTSSAADERSQESDALEGSFFTHSLATGLRGAADRSGDGRVTLSEAYRYAYDRTLAMTERTLGGAQHASYDVQMAGTGDLVLTDLATTTGRLVIPREVGRSVSVRQVDGPVVAELDGRRLEDTVLAVSPGRYELVVGDGSSRSGATVLVTDTGGEPVHFDPDALEPLPPDSARSKGGKSPVNAVLAGIAVGSTVGAVIGWEAFSLGGHVNNDGDVAVNAFYFLGATAVLSTTALVVRVGAR